MTEATKKDAIGADPGDAAREMIEKGAAAGRQYSAVVGAAAIAGLRSAFDIQNSFIEAGRSLADATVIANAKLTDKLVENVMAGQTEATRLAEAGAKLASDTLEVRS